MVHFDRDHPQYSSVGICGRNEQRLSKFFGEPILWT